MLPEFHFPVVHEPKHVRFPLHPQPMDRLLYAFGKGCRETRIVPLMIPAGNCHYNVIFECELLGHHR